MKIKICSKCKEEKEVCEFSIDKTKKDGYMSWCKICRKIKEKKYREQNPEKVKLRRKKYYNNNKIKHNDYFTSHRNENFLFKLTDNVRRRLNFFLRKKNITKRNSTFLIIGCSPEFLKEYIEKKFTNGMSWNKLGKEIHIDHIIPLSSAKNEEEVYKLCHYTNLQPLWSKDNMSKGSKLL
jgi:hypothetical protein